MADTQYLFPAIFEDIEGSIAPGVGTHTGVTPTAGPFYFAMTGPLEKSFDPSLHLREDRKILSFKITHEEGKLATLEIVCKNPKVGPLSTSMSLWCWFSWRGDYSYTALPLFHGRLIGMPTNILSERVTFVYVARPEDYQGQKITLSEELKVLPYYDPVFVSVDALNDPDVVLEGYPALWHVDRVTHEVTASDVLVGEDGTLVFTEDDALYDSVSITMSQVPIQRVDVTANVPWKQTAQGVVDLGTFTISSNTDGIATDWPKPGDDLGGGWVATEDTRVIYDYKLKFIPTSWSWSYTNTAKKHANGDTMSVNEHFSGPAGTLPGQGTLIKDVTIREFGQDDIGKPWSVQRNIESIMRRGAGVSGRLVLGYGAGRDRKEDIAFSLASDLQPVLHDPDSPDSVVSKIDLNGNDPTLPIGLLPIVNEAPDRSGYFPTDRGLLSLENLICRARAKLLIGSRVVNISWDTHFRNGLDLSCRMNAQIYDSRIPGGTAVGKIISYTMSGDGDTGQFRTNVTIGCAVGRAQATIGVLGDPDYVEDAYVEYDYQRHIGSIALLPASDVGYTPPYLDTSGELVFPLNHTNIQAIVHFPTSGDLAIKLAENTQEAPPGFNQTGSTFLLTYFEEKHQEYIRASVSAEAQLPTYLELILPDVSDAAFEFEYIVDTTKLQIPRGIDLEFPTY